MASVQVGEPIDLKSVIAEHADWSNERLATKVRRVLLIHLAREAMAISRPKVKFESVIQREVLERKAFDNRRLPPLEISAFHRKLPIPRAAVPAGSPPHSTLKSSSSSVA